MVAEAGSGGFNPYAQPNPYGPPPGAQPPADPYGPPPGGYGNPGAAPGAYGQPQGGFGAPSPQPGGFGAPGQPPQQYGGPPPAAGGYGAPPPQAAFGAAPGGYGQPQGGFGGPPAPYGAPGGFSPPQDLPYGGGGGALAPLSFGGQRGPIGKIRNPVLTIVLGYVTCGIFAIISMWGMLNELKTFRGKDDINPILFFLPIIGIIEGWKLNEKVLDAKRMAGVPNPQVAHPVLYLFFALFFLPGDLNEVWQAASGGQLPPPS
jgi:hypothetical protein